MNKIVGQDKLVGELESIFDIFIASQGEIKPHFVLTGNSGTGKSYTIKSLCEAKELNFLEINAAQLTKEGMAGNSLSKALSPIINYKDRLTIVFADEFDKLFISNNSNASTAHETTTGVQNEFLKMLESNTTSVYGDYGKYYSADMSKVLFVFAGAFNNEPNITIDKLRDFGVKTEFLGRVGLVYNTEKLSLDHMYEILDNSALLDTYLKIFTKVSREEVIETIQKFLRDNEKFNTIGARLINTLIHQYFVKGGKLGSDEVKEIAFQHHLEF